MPLFTYVKDSRYNNKYLRNWSEMSFDMPIVLLENGCFLVRSSPASSIGGELGHWASIQSHHRARQEVFRPHQDELEYCTIAQCWRLVRATASIISFKERQEMAFPETSQLHEHQAIFQLWVKCTKAAIRLIWRLKIGCCNRWYSNVLGLLLETPKAEELMYVGQ